MSKLNHSKKIFYLQNISKRNYALLAVFYKLGIIYGFKSTNRVKFRKKSVLIYCKDSLLNFKTKEIQFREFVKWKDLSKLIRLEPNSCVLVSTILGIFSVRKAFSLRIGGYIILKFYN